MITLNMVDMEDMIKIGVVGSRSFNDYELLKRTLDEYLGKVWVIVSGGAKGADSLGEKWARENNIKTCIYKADWAEHGKAAGMIRNVDIVKDSDLIIAFWDGLSRGTEHSINLAKKMDKEVKIIYFNKII
jgi:hypothetical protein